MNDEKAQNIWSYRIFGVTHSSNTYPDTAKKCFFFLFVCYYSSGYDELGKDGVCWCAGYDEWGKDGFCWCAGYDEWGKDGFCLCAGFDEWGKDGFCLCAGIDEWGKDGFCWCVGAVSPPVNNLK